MECVFCKIINNEIPSYTIYEDDVVKVFLDANPDSNGHTLIIPKVHTLDVETIDDDTYLYIKNIAKKMKKTIEEKLDANGISLTQNNGCCQQVKHYHLHLIPRYCHKDVEKMDIKDVYEKLK